MTTHMLPPLGFSSLEELERVLALEKALPRGKVRSWPIRIRVDPSESAGDKMNYKR